MTLFRLKEVLLSINALQREENLNSSRQCSSQERKALATYIDSCSPPPCSSKAERVGTSSAGRRYNCHRKLQPPTTVPESLRLRPLPWRTSARRLAPTPRWLRPSSRNAAPRCRFGHHRPRTERRDGKANGGKEREEKGGGFSPSSTPSTTQ